MFVLNDLCKMAIAAGEIILRYYKQPIQVTAKADHSPLSEADQASHNFLVDALKGLNPSLPVISEESGETNSVPSGIDSYWLVDPLDGTKEFLKGTDEFTVNIALIKSGRPILGVVYAPALGLIYYADKETGAWRKQGNDPATQIKTRPADPQRLAIVASKDHAGPKVETLLSRSPGAELKSMGSSLKFCLVAEGKADLYLRNLPTMEWDTAAAQAVVEAAGGSVCDLSGIALGYRKEDLKNPAIMTVGDPRFHWKLLLNS